MVNSITHYRQTRAHRCLVAPLGPGGLRVGLASFIARKGSRAHFLVRRHHVHAILEPFSKVRALVCLPCKATMQMSFEKCSP